MKRSPLAIAGNAVLMLALIYFILAPVAGVLIYGFFDQQNALTAKDFFYTTNLLKNSLVVALPTTGLSVLFGTALVLTVNRVDTRLAGVFRVIAYIPLIDPPFVGSIAFIMLFGRNGLITHRLLGLETSPYGWHGIVLLQVLSLSAIAFLLIGSALKTIDLSLEEAARTLGMNESQIFYQVTLKMMIPEITNTALLIFLMSLADFTTPLIIGGSFQTLASGIYLQITGVYNMKLASLTGIILLIPCLAAFLAHRHRLRRSHYVSDTGSGSNLRFPALPKGIRLGLILLSASITLLIALKNLFIIIGALVNRWGYDYTPTLKHFQAMLSKDFSPFLNTIRLAVIVGITASLLGVGIAYLVRSRRVKNPDAVDFLTMFPAAVPGILFGIGYLVIFRYPMFGIGRFILKDWPQIVLLGTKAILYIICLARFANVGLRTGYATLEHMDPDLENAAFTLGASPFYTFRNIMLPVMKDAFFSAFFKNLSTAMTTLGAIIFLILPSNKVAIQLLFQILASSSIGDGAAMAILISVMNVLLLILFQILFYHSRYIERWRRWRNARQR